MLKSLCAGDTGVSSKIREAQDIEFKVIPEMNKVAE